MSIAQYEATEADRRATQTAIERQHARQQVKALRTDPPMLSLLSTTLDLAAGLVGYQDQPCCS